MKNFRQDTYRFSFKGFHPVFLFLVGGILANCLLSCNQNDSFANVSSDDLPEKVDFNYHIRPILSDRCFACHGPDKAARKADLRLDQASAAYHKLKNGRKPVFAGKLHRSEVWQRINSLDPETKMPPPESKLMLTDYEKALIGKWIRQGGEYKTHWAFLPVEKPNLPSDYLQGGAKNPIDYFVEKKLKAEQLSFSPPADKERIIRRLSFDLTGLPPDLQEIDDFLADTSVVAYERVVDRLLGTVAYAERMTQDWLDLARYADSQGLHSDGWRSMYPWRDWVIKAFNENMPYDRFLSWQLAGDLHPDPSRDQIVATGFNRNHKSSAEGGIVDEEFRMEYVHDRVATTATTFMGLTMECARCHDHKYDPISQEDYYRFFAFFNQIDELGMIGDDGNAGPNLLLPSPATQARIQQLDHEIRVKRQALTVSEKELADRMNFISDLKEAKSTGVELYLPFDQIVGPKLDGHASAAIAGEVEIKESSRGKVVELDGEYEFINIKKEGLFDQNQAFAVSIWINPYERRISQTIVGNSGAKNQFWRGWDLILDSLNRPTLRLINALPHDQIQVQTLDSVLTQQWTHLAFSYDGMGKADGIHFYINGELQKVKVIYDQLERSIYPIGFNKEKANTPLRLGKSYRAFTGEYGIYKGTMDEFRLFNRTISKLEALELAEKTNLAEITSKTDQEDQNALFDTWRMQQQHPLKNEISILRKQQIDLLDTVPQVMVMKEIKQARPTFILNRGNYNEPTREVQPGMPPEVLPYPDSLANNRMDLVNWLLSPKHPLTSRVAVNRYWLQFFGRGLVDTPHDFGLQGSLPSHPELLDWLAATFVERGWNIKALVKTIVMSRTYRQSSKLNPELLEKDPDNIWLARGPSYRLPAEMIRDNALASSGLLYKKVGGASVKPVQPDGLWKEKTSSTYYLRHYEADSSNALYRRSLYTFVRRTSPHPAMTAFDGPNRSICQAQRQLTNTPMQALVLLNDPQFIEAARVLAQRVLRESADLNTQLSLLFRLLTGRRPDNKQLEQLMQLFKVEQERFREAPETAGQLLSIGAYPMGEVKDTIEIAAMTLVSQTLMNFDDYYTKR